MPEVDARQWALFLEGHPNAHLLQTAPWGELKSGFGWQPVRILTGEEKPDPTGAQLLFRQLPLGLTFAYLPKGPVYDQTDGQPDWQALLPEIDAACRRRRAIFLKVEPDHWEGSEPPLPQGFSPSPHSVQPRRTLLVDLRGSEEQVLANMKQKTRYNIKLALKKGVIVHACEDIEAFYRLMKETGGRDRFGVHSFAYYQRVYELFQPRGLSQLFLASFNGEYLAGLMVFARGTRAYYLYGASANEHRERMPTYLLQWEAMRWARAHGCLDYDLYGVPDQDEAALEAEFSARSDGLWGVYRFKRGFGGMLCRSAAPYDRVYQPALYHLYKWWIGRRGLQG
jgi:peptidoglycan pentaglycine glycine transferase (the first glycine)